MEFIKFYTHVFLIINLVLLSYIVVFAKRRALDSIYILIVYALSIGCNYRYFGFSMGQILMLVVMLFGCFGNFYGLRTDKYADRGAIKSLVMLYILYMSGVTIIGYICSVSYKVEGSIIQNEFRPIMQIVQLIALMFTVLYAMRLKREESLAVLNIFNKALLFIAFLGILQWVLFLVLRIDIFPIDREYSGIQYGVSALTSAGFVRACSCVGEPKQFAKFMCIGISLELFCGKYGEKKHLNIGRLVIYGGCILMTASATGVLIAVVAFALYFFMKTERKGLACIGVFAGIAMLLIALKMPFVASKIAYHVERGQIPGLEDCDTTVVRWLISEPLYGVFGVGMGNTVCYAHDYIPSREVAYIANYLFTLRRGLIKYIGEGGIVGIFLILGIFYKFINRAKKDRNLVYEIVFLVIMNLFLTLEAIEGLQFILMALISNVAYKPADIEQVKHYSHTRYKNRIHLKGSIAV